MNKVLATALIVMMSLLYWLIDNKDALYIEVFGSFILAIVVSAVLKYYEERKTANALVDESHFWINQYLIKSLHLNFQRIDSYSFLYPNPKSFYDGAGAHLNSLYDRIDTSLDKLAKYKNYSGPEEQELIVMLEKYHSSIGEAYVSSEKLFTLVNIEWAQLFEHDQAYRQYRDLTVNAYIASVLGVEMSTYDYRIGLLRGIEHSNLLVPSTKTFLQTYKNQVKEVIRHKTDLIRQSTEIKKFAGRLIGENV